MTRAATRREMRAARAALAPGDRLVAADAVARAIASRPELQVPGYVAGYWAVGGELPLHFVQTRLAAGQVWCLPVVQGDGRLRFAPWRAGDPTVANRFGIPEPDVAPSSTLAPEDLAVVLLPLVGFDATGHRLGMGGGYYDRTFAFRHAGPPPPWLVGVGYALQEVADVGAEAWDVRLDAVVTEDGWRGFRR
jgi:5-formyltetrahydrofolate cyclo-ligase